MNLAELGFTKEEIEKKIIDQCVEEVLGGETDEDGHPTGHRYTYEIQGKIRETVSKAVDQHCEAVILPEVTKQLPVLMIKQTNHYGEQTKDDVPFTEFVVERVITYLTEKVDRYGSSDYNGRSRVQIILAKAIEKAANEGLAARVKEFDQTILVGIQGALVSGLKEYAKNLVVKK